MDADFEAYLRVDDVAIDHTDIELLRAIEEHQSIHAAANALGRSYSRSHTRVTELEAGLGPLVDRQRGGKDGGGSDLTENAWDLLAQFEHLQAAFESTASVDKVAIPGTVIESDGELATISTPVGRIRALLFEDADKVEVTFRADAITLHTPASVPAEVETSAQNRITGEITNIERGDAIATVVVEPADSLSLRVVVTDRSIQTLGLDIGTTIVGTFKATATRATPRQIHCVEPNI